MNNAVQYIPFFLLIFAGIVISQQNSMQLDHVDSSQFNSMTLCQQISNGSISNHFGETDPLLNDDSTSNTDDSQPKTVTSCNSLVNILPAANNLSFNAGEQSTNIGFYNVRLSSQTFVFQEPDPPRLS
ncbi:MAG: hypothetical protein GWN00_16090 [Aliifodinibius sp.]|nr:hypothetical protein [Fodinibius sp.]NIV12573.1 hypothetical protein [Fodinibius sp.]NIY26269.1 hypothetical protein [Fodinibius sp.]